MAKTIIAHPAQESTTRIERGIALAREHFEEIRRIAPWIWSVPSCSGSGVYLVDLKHGECSCPDRPPEDERCKHETAARYVKARTAKCSGCCKRFRHCELYEVGSENLTFFEGELLCEGCSLAHGVL
jgi:hypothetical protein